MATITKELEAIKKAFQEDPELAHSWHCNIAMACYDSIPPQEEGSDLIPHDVANEAASRFMKLAFDVVTNPLP